MSFLHCLLGLEVLWQVTFCSVKTWWDWGTQTTASRKLAERDIMSRHQVLQSPNTTPLPFVRAHLTVNMWPSVEPHDDGSMSRGELFVRSYGEHMFVSVRWRMRCWYERCSFPGLITEHVMFHRRGPVLIYRQQSDWKAAKPVKVQRFDCQLKKLRFEFHMCGVPITTVLAVTAGPSCTSG